MGDAESMSQLTHRVLNGRVVGQLHFTGKLIVLRREANTAIQPAAVNVRLGGHNTKIRPREFTHGGRNGHSLRRGRDGKGEDRGKQQGHHTQQRNRNPQNSFVHLKLPPCFTNTVYKHNIAYRRQIVNLYGKIFRQTQNRQVARTCRFCWIRCFCPPI